MGEYSWKARGAYVRDARHTHDGPEVAKPAAATRKDKKRWCRGKVGVEHALTVTLDAKWHGYPRLLRSCATCGKDFGSATGGLWCGQPPEWATSEQIASLARAHQEWTNRLRKTG